MKRFLVSTILALVGFVGMSVQAQTPAFDLVTNTGITKPSCLPQKWNSNFSGTEFEILAAPRHGVVYSWNCWNADRTSVKRFAWVITSQFILNPGCSSIGMAAFRKAESSALTTFYNAMKACGRKPVDSSAEWDSYVRLLTIGLQQPINQEATARVWFGDSFRVESATPQASATSN